jgi:TRAP-type C4-dicarboxylate transport system permease small subunit
MDVSGLDLQTQAVLDPTTPDEPALTGPLTRFNGFIARIGMKVSIVGLVLIVLTVAWQVFGRYVLHNPPTWAESLALLFVLYVALIAAAVGVRDAGHIGMESILMLVPGKVRRVLEAAIHLLIIAFGFAMVTNGWKLGMSMATYTIPGLGLPEGLRYVPLVLSGALIILFSIEHLIALACNKKVVPSWH